MCQKRGLNQVICSSSAALSLEETCPEEAGWREEGTEGNWTNLNLPHSVHPTQISRASSSTRQWGSQESTEFVTDDLGGLDRLSLEWFSVGTVQALEEGASLNRALNVLCVKSLCLYILIAFTVKTYSAWVHPFYRGKNHGFKRKSRFFFFLLTFPMSSGFLFF